jgi:hypothetical protein
MRNSITLHSSIKRFRSIPRIASGLSPYQFRTSNVAVPQYPYHYLYEFGSRKSRFKAHRTVKRTCETPMTARIFIAGLIIVKFSCENIGNTFTFYVGSMQISLNFITVFTTGCKEDLSITILFIHLIYLFCFAWTLENMLWDWHKVFSSERVKRKLQTE